MDDGKVKIKELEIEIENVNCRGPAESSPVQTEEIGLGLIGGLLRIYSPLTKESVHTTIGCGKQGFPSAQPYLSHTPAD